MESTTFSCCAYCWKDETSWDELLHFKCEGCSKKVHFGCVRSSQPSSLLDDTFYTFKCDGCSEDGKEDFERLKLSWQEAVALCLYHLQKTSPGRCGFFHWRNHICAFIDAHWRVLFGLNRKKTSLWMGTVAGTLSGGCPEVFLSGANIVEMGYWKLAHLRPPQPRPHKKRSEPKKKAAPAEPIVYLNPEERRGRKKKESVLTAAMELKKKSIPALEVTGRKKSRPTESSSCNKPEEKTNKSKKRKLSPGAPSTHLTLEPELTPATSTSSVSLPTSGTPSVSDVDDTASLGSSLSSSEPTANARLDFLNAIKMEAVEDDADLDIDIDIGSMVTLDMADFRPESPDLNSVLTTVGGPTSQSGKSPVAHGRTRNVTGESCMSVKDEPESSEGEEEEGEESEGEETESGSCDDDDEDGDDDGKSVDREDRTSALDGLKVKKKRGRPRKKRRPDDAPPPSPPPRFRRVTVFEERELLEQLNQAAKVTTFTPNLAQLRRKLLCNQTNREFGLPVFDLDNQLEKLSKEELSKTNEMTQASATFPHPPTRSSNTRETRDLDRFMMQTSKGENTGRQYTTFHQRLVGLEDHELQPVVSPYTTRVLLPFIWRNQTPVRKPIKLRLLQEIQAYPHRNDPRWVAPASPPIDFCYVRPEHIPSVNALCREFFWPGIDMSECLQYPDFSCVVLYRKIVIAFAFMVPDRGYNEAYISFIFTRPEWRGAGIASFMLYHLIQTCMGKDVLLHVSATNPAMLLYQRFGFKCQELIHNFYYKYFPFDCRDSQHAFLMRLTR